MADTLQNIKIPANVWVDLYALSGIAAGTQITVLNLSSIEVKLNTSATQPTADDAQSTEIGSFYRLKAYEESANKAGDSGAWAYSNSDGLINVGEL